MASARMLPLAAALMISVISGASATLAQPGNPGDAVAASGTHPAQAGTVAAVPDDSLSGIAADGRAEYVVMLHEPALATYEGDAVGIPSAPKERIASGRERIDVQSFEATNYVAWIQSIQSAYVADASALLGRSVEETERYQHALNAVVLRLTDAEAVTLRERGDVRSVERKRYEYLQTFGSPTFIGAPTLWNDISAPNGTGYKGEGVVIGVIDTGVNYLNNAFRATGADNFTHINPLPGGNYLGLCSEVANAALCNDKLIGVYGGGTANEGRDLDGHGSHTASTAAGSPTDAVLSGGAFRTGGVAPHANLITYGACQPGCNTLGMINQAVADGVVDVINYSIGGPNSGAWSDAISMAFLNAAAAGIFVAQATGNDGPDDSFANSYSPWVTSVASTTPDQQPGFTLTATGWNGSALLGAGGAPIADRALDNLPLIESPDFANGAGDGCAAYPADYFRRPQTPAGVGGIAVLHLTTPSNCASGVRRAAALAAGAVGTVFVDVDLINLGASSTSYSMLLADWNAIRTALGNVSGDGAAVASVSALSPVPRAADRLSIFSSRGPTEAGTLKPDLGAPGDNILAAGSPTTAAGYTGEANQAAARANFFLNSGTSMASPHVAGAAALVRQARPDWTVMEVKSALMSTANPGVLLADGTPASPNQRGAGRIDLSRVLNVGVVLDETIAAMKAADPATGGRPETLNLASYYYANCVSSCVFPRSLRNVTGRVIDWTISVEGLPVGSYSLDKATLRMGARGRANYTLTVNSAQLPAGTWQFGQVVLTPSDPSIAVSRLPIAVRAATGSISADISEITQTIAVGSAWNRNIVISNTGNPLSWNAVDGSMRAKLVDRPMAQRTVDGTIVYGFRNGTYSTPATEIESTNTNNFYVADWFDVLVDGTRITDLQYDGWISRGGPRLTLSRSAGQLAWRIYADANGVPNGRPRSTVAGDLPPLFQFPAAAGGAPTTGVGISLVPATIGDAASGVRLDLDAANLAPLVLNRGRYWFNAVGTIATASDTIAMSATSVPGKLPSAKISGPNSTVAASRAWRDLESGGVAIVGSAAPMTVGAEVTCGAPWLSYTNASGNLANGANATMQVSINAGSLAVGEHMAYLCVSSNGTSSEFFNRGTENLLIPVKLTVTPAVVGTPILATGLATPATAAIGSSTLLTVVVSPATLPTSSGITAHANLAAIGGAADQAFFDDGSNGDITAGDGTYSFAATVGAGSTVGSKVLPVRIADAQLRTATTSISVDVQAAAVQLSGSGSASPASVAAGASSVLSVTVIPATGPASTGIVVTADLAAIGGTAALTVSGGNSSQALSVGAANVYSFSVTVAAGTTPGMKMLPVTIRDDQNRTATTTISLLVTTTVPSNDVIFRNGFD